MDNKKNIFLILILLFLMLFAFISFKITKLPSLTPDENIPLSFSKIFLEKSSFKYTPPMQEIYFTNYSSMVPIPRSTILKDGNLLPTIFPGFVYLIAGFMVIFESFYLFLPLGLSILLIFYFFLFSREIFKGSKKFILPILFVVSPMFILWSMLYFSNFLSFTLTFIGIFYLLKYDNTKKTPFYLLSLFFIFSSTFVRYDNFLLIIPIIFYLFLNKEKRFRNIFILLLFFFFFVTSALMFNKLLLGDYFTTPYTVKEGSGFSSSLNLIPKMGLVSDRLLINIKFQILLLLPILSVLSIIGLIFLVKKKSTIFSKNYLIFLISLIFIFILFFGVNLFFGYRTSTPPIFFSSYVRYWMIIYFLMFLFAIIYLFETNLSQKIKILFLFILVLNLMMFSIPSENKGIISIFESKKSSVEVLNFVNTLDYSNKVFICTHCDEILFPKEAVLIVDPNYVEKYLPGFSEKSQDEINSLRAKDISFLAEHYKVFLIQDATQEFIDIKGINSFLNSRGFSLKLINSSKYPIYAVEKSS